MKRGYGDFLCHKLSLINNWDIIIKNSNEKKFSIASLVASRKTMLGFAVNVYHVFVDQDINFKLLYFSRFFVVVFVQIR